MSAEQIATITTWLGAGAVNIFGLPFAGKDTQAKKLQQMLGGHILGGGEILRNSSIPPHIEATLHRGELIPSQDYVDIVLPYLSREEFADQPLLLSSVGRWIGEEVGVIEALKTANHELKAVVYLQLEEDVVRERWLALGRHDDRGGRYDDTAEILEVRLAEFREKSLPVLVAYDELDLLVKIDGNKNPEDVTKLIIKALLNMSTFN